MFEACTLGAPLPLREMVEQHRFHASSPRWSAAAEAALASIELLPANVASLRLSKEELDALEQHAARRLLAKQRALLRVPDACAMLADAIHLATNATPWMGVPVLALNLMLLSGRRSSEILNGRSTFSPARATTCVFGGQLKRRGEEEAPYTIPLLCSFDAFQTNLAALREAQGYETLDNVACNQRYGKALQLATRKTYPMATRPHALRSIYMGFVMELYACETTFNLCAMRALGHAKLEHSLAYNACELGGVEGLPEYGPLP